MREGGGDLRAPRGSLTLTFCMLAALPWWQARAQSAPAPTWYLLDPQTSYSVIGADATGFWNQSGEHYRPDGKRDLSLKLPEALRDKVRFATSGPAGPVVAGSVEEGSGATRVLAYDRRGNELWSVNLGGDCDKSGNCPNSAGPDGLFVDPNGDVVLVGHFSGCVRFGGKNKGKRTCINEKAAQRFDNGICDPCQQAFVAVYDARGKFRSVFAPPGYPANFFAAAADGRIAVAGGWDASLDLDPDPDPARAVVLKQPGNPKPGQGDTQAFWSIFDRLNGMRWLGGQGAVVRHGSTYPDGIAFDADGALVTVFTARPGKKTTCTLTDGTTSTRVPVESPHSVLVAVEKKGDELPDIRRTTDRLRMTDTDPVPRVLASPTGGVFAFGALEAPAGALLVEAPEPHQRETAIVGVHGLGKGVGVRLPNEVFLPQAVLAHEGRICFAFAIRGPHKLASGAGTIVFGRPQATTNAIGCFSARVDK